jgi:hypothetical protein
MSRASKMSVSVKRVVRCVKRAGYDVSEVWRDAMSITGKWLYVGIKIRGVFADPITIGEIRRALPVGVHMAAVKASPDEDLIFLYLQIDLGDGEAAKCVTY